MDDTEDQALTPRTVSCPQCDQDVLWTASNRYRPFCSARCKGIDFGAWAAEDYRVAGAEATLPEGLE